MDITDIINKLNKVSGLSGLPGDSNKLAVEIIPFDIPILDANIGGGVPRGRIIIFDGDSQSGKTFLSQKLIESAQSYGFNPVYFNAENKFDPDWFKKTGVDLEKLVLVKGNIAESVFNALTVLVAENIELIIVDSLTALIPTAEDEEDMEQQFMGLQARVFSKGFRKLTTAMSTSDSTVVFTSQKRSGMGKFAPDFNPGGKASTFYSSMILNVRRSGWLEAEKNERIGFNMTVKSMKNNIFPPWKECNFPFYFTNGQIDLYESLIVICSERGIVEKTGAWYNFDEQKFHGIASFSNYLRENKDMYNLLRARLSGEIPEGEESQDSSESDEDKNNSEENLETEESQDENNLKEENCEETIIEEQSSQMGS